MKYQLVSFDFDGTLVDTTELFYPGTCHVFRSCGTEPPSEETFYSKIDFLNVFEFYYGYGIPRHFSEARINELWTEFWLCQSHRLNLRESAKEILNFCLDKQAIVSIVSGNSRPVIEEVLRNNRILHLISHIEADARKKNESLSNVLWRYSIKPEEAIAIGDSVEDIWSAKYLGITSVGIIGGFHDSEKIAGAKPDHTISSLKELFEILGE